MSKSTPSAITTGCGRYLPSITSTSFPSTATTPTPALPKLCNRANKYIQDAPPACDNLPRHVEVNAIGHHYGNALRRRQYMFTTLFSDDSPIELFPRLAIAAHKPSEDDKLHDLRRRGGG
ncbi:hypothetical protein CEP54_007066 [Fusarium duplospermum]|uniref:Uncharacterized protein n=1 Tax=Fusarium duplospermum TaxID=1325734 RepID=A0A428Q3P4_9HYPO|nr:hypothetical protein CEP54_007066 [Fusarium duplospermum]